MSYHGLGAGPGPTQTYRIDMPLPWGDDTEVTVPMYAIVQDLVREAERANLADLVPYDSINRRIQASIPVWVDQLEKEIDPYVNEVIDRATSRALILSGLVLGAAFAGAWLLRARKT